MRLTSSSFLSAAGLLLLLAGCGGVTSAGPGTGGAGGSSSGAGTGGTTGAGGSAGTSGTAGTTGGAGTSGSAGTSGGAGTTGSAGTSGGAGTTGGAGRGGGGGTTGAAGRGGTTGSAGTTGGAGRGGGGGTTGAAGRGGTTGSAGAAGTGGGAGGTGGGGVCSVLCTTGRMCCGGSCVNLQNDPANCGKCGVHCEGSTPYCGDGVCGRPPCDVNTICIGTAVCCGSSCCGAGSICCEEQGPLSRAPSCFTPTADQPTCPQGCAPLCRSDRNQKKNIVPADTKQILDRVARLPISTWTYVEEPNDVRHLGPMAQDFHASFGLGGSDDRTYNTVDAHGVTMAAIQELEKIVAAQEKRIEKLERDNRRLERRLHAAPANEPASDRR